MENKKTKICWIISIVILFVLAAIMLLGVCTPLIPGKIGVIQELITCIGGILFALYLIGFIITCSIKLKTKLDKGSICCLIVFFLIAIALVFGSSNSIKAIGSEPKEITSYDYYVDYERTRSKARDNYKLIINIENDKTLNIEITKSMYLELKQTKIPIKITYYPYVNIIDDFEYL